MMLDLGMFPHRGDIYRATVTSGPLVAFEIASEVVDPTGDRSWLPVLFESPGAPDVRELIRDLGRALAATDAVEVGETPGGAS